MAEVEINDRNNKVQMDHTQNKPRVNGRAADGFNT